MKVGRFSHITGLFVTLAVVGCGSSGAADDKAGGGGSPGAGGSAGDAAASGLTGTAFGQPFTARDVLLVHPRTWKSAADGSTAMLLSDTPNLCQQITSGKTTAPGRLLILSLEKRGSDGNVVALDVGQFSADGQGTPSSRYGELFANQVDAQCSFSKLFSDRSSIAVTAVGAAGSPVTVSIDVHFTSNDSLTGMVTASTGCDEAAVDHYLNASPTCG